jgi:hypothetical protein
MKLTRSHLLWLGFAIVLALGGVWVAQNTEWVNVEVPNQSKEAAKREHDHLLQELITRLGAKPIKPKNLQTLPPLSATVVLNSWDWALFPERTKSLQSWVENGGHLVVPRLGSVVKGLSWVPVTVNAGKNEHSMSDPAPQLTAASDAADAASAPTADASNDGSSVSSPESAAEKAVAEIMEAAEAAAQAEAAASGSQSDPENSNSDVEADEETREIDHETDGETDDDSDSTSASRKPRTQFKPTKSCPGLTEASGIPTAFGGKPRFYATCFFPYQQALTSSAPLLWALDNRHGHAVVRVAVGRGKVTATNADMPWSNSRLLDHDNGLLAVAVLQIQPGSEVWLLDHETHPPLLAFLWNTGAPAVLLGALALCLALWRGAARFGPPAAALPVTRRSVAEQIRGTANFVAHQGSTALHTAQVRALHEAAQPRIHGINSMVLSERAAAIAKLTHLDADALARAMNLNINATVRRHPSATLVILETARRRLLANVRGAREQQTAQSSQPMSKPINQ